MFMSEKVRKGMEAGSWIRRMFDEGAIMKKKYGADKVFDLTLGNPVVEPPEQFFVELRKLANSNTPGLHRYMANAGYPETRTAVAVQLTKETGLKMTGDDVVMTVGAAGAINVVLKTILNAGEEVILFTPYFVEYVNYIDNHGGTFKLVHSDQQFMPKVDALEKAISKNTRAIIINSPHNPTGVVYPEKLMREICAVLEKKEKQFGTAIYLISDEPYRKLIYDGLKYPSPLFFYKRAIIATSHSKDLALPGERIGYLAIHTDCPEKQELMNGFIYCNRTLGYVNAPAMMQQIVRYLQDVTVSIADYQKKRDFLYQNLVEMGYSVVKPQGAFYMFPKSPIPDDVVFVRALQDELVLAVPGVGFGGPGHFRISYCIDDRTLAGSLEGLKRAANKYNLK